MSPVLVLMYHAILADGDDGRALAPEDRLYAVPRAAFREQLRHIERSGMPVLAADAGPAVAEDAGVPYTGICSFRPGGIVLTFDDSWPQHAEIAAPDLAARGWPATFFLTAGKLGTPRSLAWDDARRLADDGFGLGAHGSTHRLFPALSDAELAGELAGAKAKLESALGRAISSVSLPGGAADARTRPAARAAGYARVFGSRPGAWTGDTAGVIPRCVVRGGAAGTAALARLLEDPARELARRARRAAWLGMARRILGARGYAWLHRLAAGGAFR